MHSLSHTHTSVSGEDLVTPVLLFFHAERLHVYLGFKKNKKYFWID